MMIQFSCTSEISAILPLYFSLLFTIICVSCIYQVLYISAYVLSSIHVCICIYLLYFNNFVLLSTHERRIATINKFRYVYCIYWLIKSYGYGLLLLTFFIRFYLFVRSDQLCKYFCTSTVQLFSCVHLVCIRVFFFIFFFGLFLSF